MTTVPVTTSPERVMMPVGIPGTSAPPAGALSLGDIVRILKQRIFLILFCWFSMVGIAAGLTFYLDKHHPSYRSSSIILVESPNPKAPLTLAEPTIAVDMMNRYVANQAVLVTDDGVLQDALTDVDIMSTGWYQGEPDKGKLLDELKNELVVKQIPNSSFLLVAFATQNSADAPKIVNTVIEKYIARVRKDSQSRYSAEHADYKSRLADTESELKAVRDEKESFIASAFSVPGVTEGLNIVGETYRTLAERVAQLESEKLELKAAYENLASIDPSQLILSPEMQAMIEADAQVRELTAMLSNLQQTREFTRQRVGPKHPQIRDLDARIEATQAQLDQLIRKKQEEIRGYQISSAQTAFLNATQAELALKERMLEEQAKQADIDRKLARYRSLEERQLLLEEQHSQVWLFTNQLEMIISDRGMVRVRQVGQAIKPRQKHFPRWDLNIVGGNFFGLLLGIGLALLIEVVDTSIKTTRDIVRHVHVPILGTVPDIDDEEIPIEEVEMASHVAPRSMVAESFRSIRTNLLLSAPAERQRTVLVTSSKPEEGKTSVAINLAISIAQSGRRVLLVDANFHRPVIHKLFPKSRPEGLSNVLIGQARAEELVNSTDLPNLDIMTSGPIPPNPTELLAGSYIRDLITQVTERYDQVIFDGPPILLMSDALVMAGMLDGVILVCRAKTTSRGIVQRGREQLERVNGRIFGAVLNAAQIRRGGYFREQIRSYYDYQPAESLEAATTHALPSDKEEKDSSSV